jgi:hypothetical protein
MAHAAVTAPWAVTGARSVAAPQSSRATRASGTRAVRTRRGYALYDDTGHFVGAVMESVGQLAFGQGADTVLLRRSNSRGRR